MSGVVLKGVQRGRTIGVRANSVRLRHTIGADGKNGVETQGQSTSQQQQPHHKMHQVMTSHQEIAAPIMPPNVEELQASEKARFSPHRTRDTSSAHIAAKLNQVGGMFTAGFMGSQGAQSTTFNTASGPVDSRIDVYDQASAVSLSSVMQTNVPEPFGIRGKAPVHLNMPGGQWAQDDKYVSGDLQDHHSIITATKKSGTLFAGHQTVSRSGMLSPLARINGVMVQRGMSSSTWCGQGRLEVYGTPLHPSGYNRVCLSNNPTTCGRTKLAHGLMSSLRFFHTSERHGQSGNEGGVTEAPSTQLSARQKLQRTVKEYGATVIVFHVTISLASLGICYLLVSSGIDMVGLLKSLGINLDRISSGTSELEHPASQLEPLSETSNAQVEAVAVEDIVPASDTVEAVAVEDTVPASDTVEAGTVEDTVPASDTVGAGTVECTVPAGDAVEAGTVEGIVPVSDTVEAETVEGTVPVSDAMAAGAAVDTEQPSEPVETSSVIVTGESCEAVVQSDINTRRAAGAATFVVAYAVHKVFAPVRIGITLTATPFIVRHLRRIGFLKPPKPKTN